MAAQPIVSVLMPVFNAAAFVSEAVESILAQTFGDFEFIIVDDGSTDASLEMLKDHARRDDRIQLISRPNTGIVGALNDGLAAARGTYIARMDADDVSEPERLRRQLLFLESNRDFVAVGCGLVCIDRDGDPIYRQLWTLKHDDIDAELLQGRGGLPHPTAFMRSHAVKQVGGYRRRYQWIEDLDLWMRLIEVGKLANLPDLLLKYRLHDQSICWNRNREQRLLTEQLLAETYQRRGLPSSPPTLSQALADEKLESAASQRARQRFQLKQWIEQALGEGYYRTARKYSLRLLRQRPGTFRNWRICFHTLRASIARQWQD